MNSQLNVSEQNEDRIQDISNVVMKQTQHQGAQ